jgi:sRNA-binding carbon storage regulator CsrA
MKKVPTYIRSFTDRVVETLAEKERAKERDRAARLLKINFNAPEEIKIVPQTAIPKERDRAARLLKINFNAPEEIKIVPQTAIPREADKKDKFTLLFSAKASQACGYNIARLADGSEVPYTNMTDESEHGPWRGIHFFSQSCLSWNKGRI